LATTNVSLTTSWVKLANDSDDPVLISYNSSSAYLQIATTATDVAPSGIEGHIISYNEAVIRSVVGGGFIWGRVTGDSVDATVTVVVTK
jgi:hypothetical protein